MSYYSNAPREATPVVFNAGKSTCSIFKTNKLTGPIATELPTDSPLPDVVNTCHRSRGSTLQHTHPNTYALLRRREMAKALEEDARVR